MGKTPNCTKLKVQKINNHTNKLHRNLLIKGCIYRVHIVYQFTILYIHLVYFCILCMILAYLRSVLHMFCILLHSLHTLAYIAKFSIYIYIYFFYSGNVLVLWNNYICFPPMCILLPNFTNVCILLQKCNFFCRILDNPLKSLKILGWNKFMIKVKI